VRIDQGSTSVEQLEGATASSKLLSLQDEADWSYFAADLTPVYEKRPAVVKSQREIVWLKPDVFVVFARAVTSGSGISRIWQLNSPVSPTVAGRTATFTASGSTLTVNAILPSASTLRTINWASTDTDMTAGFRFESVDATGDSSLFLNVVSLDGAAASVVVDDITGQRGVKVTFKGGGSATVRFSETTAGATIDWKRADGTTVTSGAPAMAVEVLPLMK